MSESRASHRWAVTIATATDATKFLEDSAGQRGSAHLGQPAAGEPGPTVRSADVEPGDEREQPECDHRAAAVELLALRDGLVCPVAVEPDRVSGEPAERIVRDHVTRLVDRGTAPVPGRRRARRG